MVTHSSLHRCSLPSHSSHLSGKSGKAPLSTKNGKSQNAHVDNSASALLTTGALCYTSPLANSYGSSKRLKLTSSGSSLTPPFSVPMGAVLIDLSPPDDPSDDQPHRRPDDVSLSREKKSFVVPDEFTLINLISSDDDDDDDDDKGEEKDKSTNVLPAVVKSGGEREGRKDTDGQGFDNTGGLRGHVSAEDKESKRVGVGEYASKTVEEDGSTEIDEERATENQQNSDTEIDSDGSTDEMKFTGASNGKENGKRYVEDNRHDWRCDGSADGIYTKSKTDRWSTVSGQCGSPQDTISRNQETISRNQDNISRNQDNISQNQDTISRNQETSTSSATTSSDGSSFSSPPAWKHGDEDYCKIPRKQAKPMRLIIKRGRNPRFEN